MILSPFKRFIISTTTLMASFMAILSFKAYYPPLLAPGWPSVVAFLGLTFTALSLVEIAVRTYDHWQPYLPSFLAKKITSIQNPSAKSPQEEANLALIAACKDKDVKAVERLLNNKAEINYQDQEGNSPLHYVCLSGQGSYKDKVNAIQIGQILLDHQANPTLTNKKGFAPIHLAAESGFAAILFIFKEVKIPENPHYASIYDYPCTLPKSLEKGILGATPLMVAATSSVPSAETIKTLLEHKASPNKHCQAPAKVFPNNNTEYASYSGWLIGTPLAMLIYRLFEMSRNNNPPLLNELKKACDALLVEGASPATSIKTTYFIYTNEEVVNDRGTILQFAKALQVAPHVQAIHAQMVTALEDAASTGEIDFNDIVLKTKEDELSGAIQQILFKQQLTGQCLIGELATSFYAANNRIGLEFLSKRISHSTAGFLTVHQILANFYIAQAEKLLKENGPKEYSGNLKLADLQKNLLEVKQQIIEFRTLAIRAGLLGLTTQEEDDEEKTLTTNKQDLAHLIDRHINVWGNSTGLNTVNLGNLDSDPFGTIANMTMEIILQKASNPLASQLPATSSNAHSTTTISETSSATFLPSYNQHQEASNASTLGAAASATIPTLSSSKTAP